MKSSARCSYRRDTKGLSQSVNEVAAGCREVLCSCWVSSVVALCFKVLELEHMHMHGYHSLPAKARKHF